MERISNRRGDLADETSAGPEDVAEAKPSRWSRLPVLLLMMLVLAAAGLLSAMTAMRFAIRGREVVVPELSGTTQAEAAALLFERGLELDVESSRFSDSVPEGRIIDQSPAPGVTVKRARGVQVLVSLGERKFPVPDVTGSSLRSAQMMLSQRGLAMGNMLYTHTSEGASSTVLYQSPSPGDQGGTDPSVDVLVSLGPVSDEYLMPDLRGRTEADVRTRVVREGFRLGETTYRSQPGTDPGRVVGQQPPAGYKVSRDEVIRIEVSQ
jgi:serine/threonine-protein kinase